MRDPDWDWHCADHAARAVEASTGRKLWEEVGVKPRDARSGAAVLRKLKAKNLKQAVTALLGKPVSILRARRGDIVMVDNALGICRGEWVECLDAMQPLARGECAWPIDGKPER